MKIHARKPLFKKGNQKNNKGAGAVQLDYETVELPLVFQEKSSLKIRKKSDLTENAKVVLRARYLNKNIKGEVIEDFDEMFLRVANAVSYAEIRYGGYEKMKEYKEIFYDMMVNLQFLPNSPTLMNAGNEEGQLSACFVLPVKDSMQDIFEAVKQAALIQKSGGGVGYSFSKLRPAGDRVKTTKGVSSGPISFMRVFNQATETVKQGGRRRGANMGVLRVDHPDILDFINAKNTEGEFFNFNISVGLTDVFMEAVKNDTFYDLINPRSGKKASSIKARLVWDNIIKNAWRRGDPGLLFIDRINSKNPTPSLGDIESTNPCGEACLLPYEACNLGSINLSCFVKNNSIDFIRLKKTIHLAVRFLDDVIDVNEYVPLVPKIRQITKENRKIGLGVMGFADMLIDLGISYGDEKALKIAERIMELISQEAKIASKNLAKERGPFPKWKESIYYPHTPIRNATLTSIAPTGTLSIISGCSPGIEPLFGVCFERHVLDGEVLLDINPRFKKIARIEGFYSKDLMKALSKVGTIQEFDEIPKEVKELFITAHDLPAEKHVQMQAIFQKYVDMSVSKTINLPYEATCKDVEKIYLLAYETGCKGTTVYRDGSLGQQVIYIGKSREDINCDGDNKEQLNLFISNNKAIEENIESEVPVIVYGKEEICPECGQGTLPLGTCSVCPHCGYSHCG